MKALRRLFGHYAQYHAYGPPRLKYMGILGAITYTLFFFIRFTRPNPDVWDDIGLRAMVIALFIGIALQDHWPARLKRYFIPYSYLALLYCLPFFALLTGLQRGGGVPAISNMFITLWFLVLLTDWRNTLVILAGGFASAIAVYVLTSPHPQIPMDLVRQLPAYALIVLGGNIFKFSTEQIDVERKLRATQALAGSIAHEMRHPLSRVRQSLQGIRQALPGDAEPLPNALPAQALEAVQRHLAESELAVARGLQVISMTLDQVSAKPMDGASFACISAAEIARKAVQEYGYDSDEERARVGVRVVEDFSFRGEETACLFVLFNLMKNALYYLPRHPQMRVELTVERGTLRVRDTGPGIPKEALPHLFEPFRSAGKTGGTGLGLAYCERVVRAFGGSIDCVSVVGEFTEFTLRLPALDEDALRTRQAAVLDALGAAFAGRRLLLVDQDAMQRLGMRRKLAALPVHIDEAAGGQEALDLAFRRRYDLVLLDLDMPGTDGWAVARKLRAGHGATPASVRLVAYGAEPPTRRAQARTHQAGMDGFVDEASSPLTLAQGLHDALERPRAGARDAALEGCRVLLVDDTAWNRKAVAGQLQLAGVAVTQAAHGEAALQALRTAAPFDAVVMDVHMPGMDGMEATRAIRRAGGALAALPVIGLTAHTGDALLAQAQAAGMNEVLAKPVDAERLLMALRRWTRRGPDGPGAAEPAAPHAQQRALLDAERLETYRRIGLFEDLLLDYLPSMARMIDELERQAARRDMDACLPLLHNLLGMSGEAGARALHDALRQVYAPMLEQRRWPAEADWPGRIRALADRTGEALRAYSA